MNLKTWTTLFVVAAVACVTGGGPAWAQPKPQHDHDNDQRGFATQRKGFTLVDPRGRQVDDPTQFRFILPSFGQGGAYYTFQNKHYYTPVPTPQAPGRQAIVQSPMPIEFGAFKHHEQLAHRLVALTKDLCLDLHHNYQDNPGFDETYAEAYELLQKAKFLHGKEHNGEHRAMQQEAPHLDELFHHIEHDIANWKSSDRRNIGQMRLPAKMEELEAVIHHLLFDLGVKPDHDHDHGGDNGPNAGPGDEPPPPRKPRIRE